MQLNLPQSCVPYIHATCNQRVSIKEKFILPVCEQRSFLRELCRLYIYAYAGKNRIICFFASFRSPFIFICSQIYVTLLSGRQFCLLHFPGFVSPPPPVSPKVASTEKRTTYPHLNFHAYGFPTPVPFLTLTGQVSRVFQHSEKFYSHPNLI